MENILVETIVRKGLGECLGEIDTSIGLQEIYSEYANLVKSESGEFNVSVIGHPLLSKRQRCLFLEMVSEKEAREMYNGLN